MTIRSATSPQVMQWLVLAGHYSITLAFSSSSSCSYSAPICSSSRRVAIASSSSTFDSAEADVDQHPVARSRAAVLAVEEADVDVALDAGYVDAGEPVGLVDDLQDLARDGQAHTSTPAVDPSVGTLNLSLGRANAIPASHARK